MAGGALDQPYALTLDMLELRAYQAAKEALARAEKPGDVAMTPMVAMVFEVEAELLERRTDPA